MNLKTTLAVAAALCLGATVAVAQTATPAKPAAKKVAAKKSAPKAAAAAATVALPAADADQMAAAERTYLGEYQCEFSQSIDVSMNPKANGYVDVRHQKHVWTMKPVLSSTGALRLEDVKGQTMLLQIANKSMLMDQKAGRRVVDGCVHEKQKSAALAAAK
ncbi:hypothetical protein [uncultured Piscinibacter sp.]|uniref:hypothetical protein n=1 Tax=uncultured Piscinibacter sp. TaxID=1131835 RepID=UPI002607AD0A|nr:hypothetical protein [uncultured Piscinibacter sp.]